MSVDNAAAVDSGSDTAEPHIETKPLGEPADEVGASLESDATRAQSETHSPSEPKGESGGTGARGPLKRVLRDHGVLIFALAIGLGLVVAAAVGFVAQQYPYHYLGYDPQLFLIMGLGMVFATSLAAQFLASRAENARIHERVESQTSGARPIYINGNISGGLVVRAPESNLDADTIRASDAIIKQEAILREIYTQGLEQSRTSFRVSLSFASLGAIILLYGVLLAVTHASTDGQKYASVVTVLTGTVINLTSGLFFVQSNRARQNMAEQGASLRDVSREDRLVATSRELAASIASSELRDTVRAELARSLVAIKADSLHSPDSSRSAEGR